MTSNGHVDAWALHARLNHPIIDADGPWLEYGPVMRFWAEVLAQPAVRA